MQTINEVIETLVKFEVLTKTYNEQIDIHEFNMNCSPFIFKVYDSGYGEWIDIVSIDLESDGTYIANTAMTDDSTVELTIDNFLILETVEFENLYGRLTALQLSSKFQNHLA